MGEKEFNLKISKLADVKIDLLIEFMSNKSISLLFPAVSVATAFKPWVVRQMVSGFSQNCFG